MFKLNERLNCIASLVNNGDIIADIGTDHGYLPIHLCLNEIVPFAYASDIAIKPLMSAQENIKKYHLENKIKTILTNGLNSLPENIQTVIIAGMGGHLIAKIIQGSMYNTLILQPNLHADIVRIALIENNYKIIAEEIIIDKNKFYEIIKAVKGKEEYTEQQIKYGPCNLMTKSKNFVLKYQQKIGTLTEALKNMKRDTIEYKKIVDEIQQLENIIK